ncbi:MAG TPA: PAS domain S-box protein [Chthonomonadaceae bacterium]|nr:PAS domain S-box protein [Chthonomonadaceae bacterium]
MKKLLQIRHPEIYQRLFDAAPDAIVVIDDEGKILEVNAKAEMMFGYRAEELNGETIEILIPERFRSRHVGYRAGYMAAPGSRPMGIGLQLFGRQKDGAEFPVDIMLSPSKGSDGNLTMAVIRDISERKRLEETQKKNMELEAANVAKNRFLATMSHELRTPLNAILGFTGTLLMKLPGPLNDDQQKQLTTIKASANHLLALINDLLDLAKIESGKVELTFESVACNQKVSEVVTALQPLAESKGLHFEARLLDSEFWIRSDRRAIKQILLNLTNNAIKFTETGSVRLEVERSQQNGKGQTTFRVVDTGVGIRPEDQAVLFQPFNQLHGSSDPVAEGTGLGLYLSQMLAGLLGGSIRCESEVGKGSVFTLLLKDP